MAISAAITQDAGPGMAFHTFSGLPLELRYKLYERYFSADEETIAGRSWPLIPVELRASDWRSPRTRLSRLLPDLCFVSKTLRTESLTHLMLLATLELFPYSEPPIIELFLAKLTAVSDIHILSRAKRVKINDANNTLGSHLHNHETRDGPAHKRSAASNLACSKLITHFIGARELTLCFYAPCGDADIAPHGDVALNIAGFLEGFDVGCIIQLSSIEAIIMRGA
ncbi:hypothetical protein EK21DRAFT_86066 [Setomelanomma holmii]|uniref:Uncharacterized protein n=1 Tax=Setomelanomma holmii TaxID=210430 RepID=A0A9P4HEV1_9PLEO|nr:hypothetical protein EK21DRAFT_86066 [Setomelanomma holmii]